MATDSGRGAPAAAGFDGAAVRAHYARLASGYRGRTNAACSAAFARLARRALGGCRRVVEVGAADGLLLGELGAARGVACDLSLPMLAAAPRGGAVARVAGDAQRLPFRDAAFDGCLAVNVLEHLPDPARFVAEAARVLAPGGRLLTVTPNGDLARWLDLAERLRLKLPEGPHRFLGFREMAALPGPELRLLEHRRFLLFPAGPPRLVAAVDRICGAGAGRGLFQQALFERTGRAAP